MTDMGIMQISVKSCNSYSGKTGELEILNFIFYERQKR
jgi:hypothetical protein